jgi:hypothetical protein
VEEKQAPGKPIKDQTSGDGNCSRSSSAEKKQGKPVEKQSANEEKARRQMWRMWSLVGRERGLSALGKLRVWQTIVQTILEMGGEVMRDVEWKAAEDLQIKMGKMILGTDTCNDVVRGDLGLWRVRARRWRKRLMYWRCMVNDEVAEIVKNVYEFERQRDAEGKLTWASDTRKILNKLGLGQYWWSEEKIDSRRWKKLVCESIQAFEEKEWGRRVWKNKKLRWYRRVKPQLAFEEYLQDKWTQGRRTLSRLRGGDPKAQGRRREMGGPRASGMELRSVREQGS